MWGYNENGWGQVTLNVPGMHNRRKFLGEINDLVVESPLHLFK
jgi:hypothetical protein